jgi:predicted alpha/beta hydrolase family esterase
MARLAAAIEGAPGSILIGHSLGCALIAHLAALRPGLQVAGALLVAPADADRAGGISPQVGEFAPMPRERLPFPSVVVASTNDPYMTMGRARVLAWAWSSRLVDVGPCGHINVPSGFGPWPFGEKLLDDLALECGQAVLGSALCR